MLERERKIAIRLLITGSGVRVPHNPLVTHSDSKYGDFMKPAKIHSSLNLELPSML